MVRDIIVMLSTILMWEGVKVIINTWREPGRKQRYEQFRLTTLKWLETHYPDRDARFHIQNLLGDYFGWGTPEQKELTRILSR